VKAAARADARAASAEAPGRTLLVACTGTRIEAGRACTNNNSMRARPHLRNAPRIPGSRTMRRRSRAWLTLRATRTTFAPA